MKKFDEKKILNLIVSKLMHNNLEPHFGKDDISLISLKDLFGKSPGSFSLAITCDMVVEHTDMPPQMTYKQIARKSIVSSISDLSAKGVKPLLALISLGLPTRVSKDDVEDLIDGFALASKEFKFHIIGGDLNESKELVIDCCMVGFNLNNTNVPRRNGANANEFIIVSGPFGYSASGLQILLHGAKTPHQEFKKKSIESVLNPLPQNKFGLLFSKYLSSSIDSSDGLAISLHSIAEESSVDLLIEKDKIPVPNELSEFLRVNELNFDDIVFYGGEEFHIVGTVNEQNLLKIQTFAKKNNIPIFVIGRAIKGSGKVLIVLPDGKRKFLQNKGYTHLSS